MSHYLIGFERRGGKYVVSSRPWLLSKTNSFRRWQLYLFTGIQSERHCLLFKTFCLMHSKPPPPLGRWSVNRHFCFIRTGYRSTLGWRCLEGCDSRGAQVVFLPLVQLYHCKSILFFISFIFFFYCQSERIGYYNVEWDLITIQRTSRER